jgi:TPR repeat protein
MLRPLKNKKVVILLTLAAIIIMILAVKLYALFYYDGQLPLGVLEVIKLEKKANQGDIEACWCLSKHYFKSEAHWIYWLREGAKLGDPRAQYLLSHVTGLFKDSEVNQEALKLLEVSANSGYYKAQDDLAKLHRQGMLGKRDINQAIFWFEKAAMQGEDHSMVALSTLLYETRKDKTGFIDAYKWALLAYKRNTGAYPDSIKEQLDAIQKESVRLGMDFSYIKKAAEVMAANEEQKIPLKSELEKREICKYLNKAAWEE